MVGKHQNRHEEMLGLAIAVKAELNQMAGQGYGKHFNHWITASLDARLDKAPLRAYYTQQLAAYSLSLAPTHKKLVLARPAGQHLLNVQLPLLFEGVIAVQYLHNQILDEKAGVTHRASINQNLISANLLKDSLYRYARQQVPARWADKVANALQRSFELVDLGQYLETATNTMGAFQEGQAMPLAYESDLLKQEIDLSGARLFVDKIKRDLPTLYHPMAEAYFQRIYLTCASLFVVVADLLSELMGLSEQNKVQLRSFATCYGLMRQLVNDNADWLPSDYALDTKSRLASDAFSDLRHGVLTLPVIFYLAEGNRGEVYQALQRGTAYEMNQNRLFSDIIHSNALYKSVQNARILGELAVSYLDTADSAAMQLAASCDIVHWNKFLAPCLKHEAYQVYRKTAYHLRTKALITAIQHQRTVVAAATATATTRSWSNWWQWGKARTTGILSETYANRLLRQFVVNSER